MSRAAKIAWSVFLVWHLFMMTVSMARKTPFGDVASKVTDPYQWTFGLHQNWPMFAPNPRLETAWLVVQGQVAADDSWVDLELPHGTPDPEGPILLYDRSGKLERNAISRKHLRASFVRWYCRRHTPELQAVRIDRLRQRTPAPGSQPGARATWKVERDTLEEWRCRGH